MRDGGVRILTWTGKFRRASLLCVPVFVISFQCPAASLSFDPCATRAGFGCDKDARAQPDLNTSDAPAQNDTEPRWVGFLAAGIAGLTLVLSAERDRKS
jgi:hypothetical protein